MPLLSKCFAGTLLCFFIGLDDYRLVGVRTCVVSASAQPVSIGCRDTTADTAVAQDPDEFSLLQLDQQKHTQRKHLVHSAPRSEQILPNLPHRAYGEESLQQTAQSAAGVHAFVPLNVTHKEKPVIVQPQHRFKLYSPHSFFPFDILDKRILEHSLSLGLSQDVATELTYVRDHCMTPPFPWGQVIHHDFVMKNIVHNNIPGNFAELGVGQGGTSVFLARLAKKLGRKLLAVDSFQGLPAPSREKDNAYFVKGDYQAQGDVDQMAQFLNWRTRYSVDDVMHVEKCFFADLVIPKEFDSLAFVHLDSDLYDSIYDSLMKVWNRVVTGGGVAIDDFFHHSQGPARAVADFFRDAGNPKGEPPLLHVVPPSGILIIKGQSAVLEAPGVDALSSRPRAGRMYSPRSLDGNYYSFEMMRRCTPFRRAVEQSVTNATIAAEKIGLDEATRDAINRAKTNAFCMLSLLNYSDSASRSGADIYRYLAPLEDFWDMYEGALIVMPGRTREPMKMKI